jgi:hypothetical protein
MELCKMTVFELSQTFPTQVDGTFKKYFEVGPFYQSCEKKGADFSQFKGHGQAGGRLWLII